MKLLCYSVSIFFILFAASCSDNKAEDLDADQLMNDSVSETEADTAKHDSPTEGSVSDSTDAASDSDSTDTEQETKPDSDEPAVPCTEAMPETACAGGAGSVNYACINTTWQAEKWCCYSNNPLCGAQYQLVADSADKPNGITAGKDGKLYVVGSTQEFSSDPTDAFIAIVSPDGTAEVKRFGGANTYEEAVAIANSGNDFLVAFSVNGSFNGKTHGGGTDIAVMKIDEAGNELWTTQIGGTADEDPRDIVAFADGSFAVAGTVNGAFDGHSYDSTALNLSDVLVIKFKADGSKEWSQTFGSEKYDHTNYSQNPRLAAGDNGELFVAGATLGTFASANLGSHDAYIVKLAANGTIACKTQFGTDKADTINAILRSGNTLYLAGSTEGTFPGKTNGGNECMGSSCQDMLVVKADLNCTVDTANAVQFGSPGHDAVHGIALAGNGTLFIAAHTNGLFADPIYASEDIDKHEEDIAIAAVKPDGTTWVRQLGSDSQWEYGLGITAAGDYFWVMAQTPGLLGIEHPGFAKEDLLLIRVDPAGI